MEVNSEAKASKQLTAADVITGSEDVVSEMLLCLPVKSLIRFQLVSKEWQSFIFKPHFGNKHTRIRLRRSPNFLSPRGLFFYHPGSQHVHYIPNIHSSSDKNSNTTSHFPSLSFLEAALGSLVSVIHSCNGLLLCRFASKYRFDYCICNLTTREFTLVPQPPDHSESTSPAFGLAFKPFESPYYKIVCLRDIYQQNDRKLSSHSVEILVYSSESGTWISKCCFEWNSIFGDIRKPAAYWNGAIYWIRGGICFFLDLNKEEIKLKTLTPPGDQEYHQSHDYKDYKSRAEYLGEWCGHLHAVYIRRDSDEEFHVLEFEEFSSEWFVKYTGNIAHILSRFPGATMKETSRHGPGRIYYVFTILAMIRGDWEEDSALVLAIPGKVISYNFMRKTVEVIRELPEKVYFSYRFCSFPYIETLFPVRADDSS